MKEIFKDDTVKVSKNLAHPEGHLQVKLTYAQIAEYICMDEGENYGMLVLSLRSNQNIKVASLENSSSAPTVEYVYKK